MNFRSPVIARRVLVGLVSVTALAFPAQAGAAPAASVSPSTLTVTGGSEANRLTVTVGGGSFTVADTSGDVAATLPCTQTGTPKRAVCPAGSVTTLTATLGGGGDTFDSTAVAITATVHAGSGDDVVITGGGNDTLNGDLNNDWINGGLGNDALNGGDGSDGAGYWNRTTAVTASLAAATGGATAGGESDTIAADVESLVGGAGSDVLIGNGVANTLVGGWSAGMGGVDGNDVLRGMGGTDTLNGDVGSDTADYSDTTAGVNASLDGNSNDPDSIGSDVESLTGGSGADTLTGSGGPNKLTGGGGADNINAGGGADEIVARDSAQDSIQCGAGDDFGEIDAIDVLSLDCESSLELPPPPPPVDPPDEPVDPPVDPPTDDTTPSNPPATTTPSPTNPPVPEPPVEKPPVTDDDSDKGKAKAPVRIKVAKTVRINSKGVLPVTVACTAATGTCRGKIALFEQNGTLKARTDVTASRRRKPARRRKAIKLGARKFSVRAGEQKTVPLRLDRAGRRRVIKAKGRRKGRKRRRGKIVITMKAPNGNTVTTVKNVTIVGPKERRGARRPAGRGRRR